MTTQQPSSQENHRLLLTRTEDLQMAFHEEYLAAKSQAASQTAPSNPRIHPEPVESSPDTQNVSPLQ